MHQQLKERLWAYIVQNNPDLMHRLQDEYGVVKYLEGKVSGVMPKALKLLGAGTPGYAIIERCMDDLTAELRPSRYQYIVSVLHGTFEDNYRQFRERGLLAYEAVRLVEHCKPVFDRLHFSEDNKDDAVVRTTITEAVSVYLGQK